MDASSRSRRPKAKVARSAVVGPISRPSGLAAPLTAEEVAERTKRRREATAQRRSPATQRGFRAGRPSWNKGKRFPAEVLTENEIKALISACSSKSSIGLRNRALITVLYRGGLRISEALDLYPKDIDRDGGSITVLHGKGDKRRVIGLDPGAFAVLERWLERRKTLGLTGHQRVFSTLKGTRIHSSYVRGMLRRAGLKAGIEKRVHPHGLRHAHTASLVAERMPVHLIRDQLGHSSLAVTDRYLRAVAPHELLEAMQSRPVWDV